MSTSQSRIKTESRATRTKRMLTVAAPAGVVTFGLFMAMQNFVAVESVEAPELTVYELDAYMETKPDDPDKTPRPKVRPPEPISPPPSPPKLVSMIDTPDLPIGFYDGATPADYGAVDLDSIKPVRVSAFSIRDLQPITPPIPDYPRDAISKGLEGLCDVHLSVSIKGDPFDVRADCSHRAFVRAAEKSIKNVKFAPQIRDGLPVTVTGVVYPLEFRLKQ